MQRIRIGLTGLAFVFLLVLLGTAISRGSEEAAPNGPASANLAQPNEPLAELGVAPAQETDQNSANVQRNVVQ